MFVLSGESTRAFLDCELQKIARKGALNAWLREKG